MTLKDIRSKIQAFLNDKKAENRILGYEEEYSLEDILNAVNLALEEINYKGIIKTSYTLDTCDPYLLRLGAAKYLLSGEIAMKTRNYVTVNDGGISVNREGNIELYYRMYQQISDEFNEQLDIMKNNANLLSGYGH